MSSLMIVFAKDSESDLILLIKGNNAHAEYWCITNGSEPITWLDTKNPNENGRYFSSLVLDYAAVKLKYI